MNSTRGLAPRRTPRFLALALAAALAIAGLAVPGLATPAEAAPKHAVTLKGPKQIRSGKAATLRITWRKSGTPATGKVRLQHMQDGSWRNVRKVAVTNGTAQVKVRPTSTTRYRIKKGARTSRVVRVKVVKQWITHKAPQRDIRAGEAAALHVQNFRRAAPAAGTLELQRKVKKGWKTIRTVDVGPEGAVVDVTPKKDRTFRFARGKHTSPARTIKVERSWVSLELDNLALENSSSTTQATIRWYQGGKPATGTAVLQQRLPGGKWTKLRDVAVAKGAASVTLQPMTPRRYRVVAGGMKSTVSRVTVDTVVPASFTITGSGWGHGLGMSQYGAYAMAKAGRSVADILTHYYTDTAVEDLAFPTGNATKQQLKVQVIGPSPYSGRASDRRTSVPVTVRSGGWALRTGAGAVASSSSTGKRLTFRIESGRIAVYQEGLSAPIAKAKRFQLRWDDTRYRKGSSRNTYVTVDGAHGSYRHGRLDVRIINGQLNIVNELLLNTEYLYGIAEMPSSWGENGGAAALQAQAIAARNYAATAFLDSAGNPVTPKASCRCHIVDDVYDQHFTGWNKEGEGIGARFGKIWKAAVDATVSDGGATGKVLRYTGSDSAYQGKLAIAYYSSSSGGHTLNSEDVWSAYVPYIRSVKDEWSHDPASGNPNIKWTATMTQREAQAFFGLPDVVSIRVSQTYEGGAMRELEATSSSGVSKRVSGKADSMRTRLNAASSGYVKSSTVTSFEPVGVA